MSRRQTMKSLAGNWQRSSLCLISSEHMTSFVTFWARKKSESLSTDEMLLAGSHLIAYPRLGGDLSREPAKSIIYLRFFPSRASMASWSNGKIVIHIGV